MPFSRFIYVRAVRISEILDAPVSFDIASAGRRDRQNLLAFCGRPVIFDDIVLGISSDRTAETFKSPSIRTCDDQIVRPKGPATGGEHHSKRP